MLFVHEVHTVAGEHDEAFDEAFREGWAPALADGGDARLLWYLHQAHGTGPAYTVVTVTAVRDAAAWEGLTQRVAGGDLTDWWHHVDELRHSLASKVLRPLEWSPLHEVDLDAVPAAGDHDQALFMEDTAWPRRGRYAAYLELAGTKYVETLRRADEAGRAILRLEAAFTPVYGTGVGREVVLWQRVARPEHLLGLLSRDVPAEYRAPGTWMHDALDVRDRWESRLLRTAAWSPLP